MRGVSSWGGAIRVQRTASSPVASDTAQPGSRAPAGGYSVVCPDGAHGSVAAAPGPEFLGCRACLLARSLPPARSLQSGCYKEAEPARMAGGVTVALVRGHASQRPSGASPRAPSVLCPVATPPSRLPPSDHTGASAVPSGMSGARTMGRCPPEGSARVHLAPSCPKLSPGLWRAVGWRPRVHRYFVLSENGLDGVGATRGPSSCQCYRHTPSPCLHVAYSLTGEKEAQQTV